MYGNVILSPFNRQASSEQLRLGKREAQKNSGLTYEQGLARISNSSNPRQTANFFARDKIFNSYSSEQLVNQFIDKDTTHESGHLYFSFKFLNFFKPQLTNTTKDFHRHVANFSVHDEITAILVELRYFDEHATSLLFLLQALDENSNLDFAHRKAGNWVLERIINLSKIHRKKLGLTINQNSDVSLENQIILQLPEIFKKQATFNDLIEQAIDVHKKNIQQDFSAQYFQYQGLPIPSDLSNTPLVEPEPPKEFPVTETAIGVGAVAGLGTGAALAYKYDQRRKLAAAEDRLPKLLRDAKIPKNKIRDITDGLQFGKKGKGLNAQARANALAELARLAESNPSLGGAAGFLRRKLGEKEKKKNDGKK